TKAAITMAARTNSRTRGRITLTLLSAPRDPADVFAHHLGRAEPDEKPQREVAHQQPVELAYNWNHVELERGRREQQQDSQKRDQLGGERHPAVIDKAVEEPREVREVDEQPAKFQ